MDSIYQELDNYIKSKDEKKIKETLTLVIARDTIELKSVCTFECLLTSENTDILLLTAQVLAEIAKSEENRKLLTSASIINSLLRLINENNIPLLIQVFRALGNILYENKEARLFIDSDKLKDFISIINSLLETEANPAKVLSVTSGCLLNLLTDNETLLPVAVEQGLFTLIERIFKYTVNNLDKYEDLMLHLLLLLNVLTEQLVETWLSESLLHSLVDILKTSDNIHMAVFCLEILHGQAENNDIKLCLAKEGACELIFDLLEKHASQANDEESRIILKMACDLIVIILTGDESMELLYENGKGKFYQNMLSWLQSTDDDLLSTGILAIGNFAREDTHCIQMVENGLAKKLLDLLSKNNKVENDVKLQHATLGALRNLVIPIQNKSKVLEDGLINILYPMINVDHSLVTFKLLGTLRMIVDGQEKTAEELITHKGFIEKLVYWNFNSDHLGVRGESSRLLSWLIKNCHKEKLYLVICRVPDSLKCLSEMIASNHSVMQNEALLALNLLCAGCLHKGVKCSNDNNSENNVVDNPEKSVEELNLSNLLIKADVGRNITFLLNKYVEKLQKEILENLLTLLGQLVTFPELVKHLQNAMLQEALVKLLDKKIHDIFCNTIKNIIDAVDSG